MFYNNRQGSRDTDKLPILRNTSNIFFHPWGRGYRLKLGPWAVTASYFSDKCCTGAVWRCVCIREAHFVFQCDGSAARWVGGCVWQWLKETYPRKLVERVGTVRNLVSCPRVALRTDSALWPPLTGFAITLTEHTTLGRTPLDKWSACRWDLYLATQHSQQTDIQPPARGLFGYRIKSDGCCVASWNTVLRFLQGLLQFSWQDFRQLWQRSWPAY